MSYLLLQANARRIPLKDKSVHCVITSPPYWGLRDYQTGRWEGGDPGCEHRAKNPEVDRRTSTLGPKGIGLNADNAAYQHGKTFRDLCGRCGARRIDHQLGLEPSPEEYVAHMVEVFREVWRVLRDDGTLWLNIGDSYAAHNGGAQGATSQRKGRSNVTEQRRGGIPKGYAPKNMIGIPWRLALALQADGWYLRSDCIWCLSGGAWVYARTQKGDMPMMVKDLVRLDPRTVQLWNGVKWTQVLGCNRSRDPERRIELVLRSGERIGCTGPHLWPTQRGDVRADELRPGDVIRTCTLPEPEGAQCPGYLIDDALWFVGLYLAEGSRAGDTIQISGHAAEMHRVERLALMANHYGGSITHTVDGNNLAIRLYGRILIAILDTYIGGLTAHDKHLKVAAWSLPNVALRRLAEGYLEGDGHADPHNPRIRLGFCRNYALERDIRTLAARLGAALTLKPVMVTNQSGKFAAFHGEWRWERSGHWNEKDRGEVVEVRQSRARQFWDIGVADDPHLFALASGVLTHNSKPNPMPESVRDRPTKSHEYVFLFAKGQWKTRIIQFADLPCEFLHFGQYLRSHGQSVSDTARLAVHLATAIFDVAEHEEQFRLPPFYSEVWKQGPNGSDSDFVRSLPIEHRSAIWAARFLSSEASAKEFLGELHRLWGTLPDGNDLLKRWATIDGSNSPCVTSNGDGAVTVHDAGKVSKVDFVHGRVIVSQPSGACYFYDAVAIKERVSPASDFGSPRPDRPTPSGISDGFNDKRVHARLGHGSVGDPDGRNLRSVLTIATNPYKGAHFAVMPSKLAATCIKAGTSRKGCCPRCGAPWRRKTKKSRVATRPGTGSKVHGETAATVGNRDPLRHTTETRTVGWAPTCRCEAGPPVPSVVFDPFNGAGTTGVVSLALGRMYVGVDLKRSYLDMSRSRIERPHARIQSVRTDEEDLPLFRSLT